MGGSFPSRGTKGAVCGANAQVAELAHRHEQFDQEFDREKKAGSGYNLCDHVGKLSELPVMLHKMEQKNWNRIHKTVTTAPVPVSKNSFEFVKGGTTSMFA